MFPISHCSRVHAKSSWIAKTSNALPLCSEIMIASLIFQFNSIFIYEICIKLHPQRALGFAFLWRFIHRNIALEKKNVSTTIPGQTSGPSHSLCLAYLPHVSGFDLGNHCSSLGHSITGTKPSFQETSLNLFTKYRTIHF